MAERPITIDLAGLGDGWRKHVEEYPVCAACGERIGSEEHAPGCAAGGRTGEGLDEGLDDCTCGADEVPLLIFRGKGRGTLSLALHWKCAEPRLS